MAVRPRPLVLVLVFAACAGAGLAGLAIAPLGPDYTIAVWPASGIALAAAVVLGRAVWPATCAAAAVTMYAASGSVAWALVGSAGFALEPIASAVLIDRLARGSRAFRRPETIVRFIAIVAVTGAPLAATGASLAAALAGPVGWHALAATWLNWWLASLAGTFVVAPIVMSWTTAAPGGIRLWAALEGLGILAALVFVCIVVFAGRLSTGAGHYSLEFLCAPVLLWAAFRQGRRTVSLAAAILCAMAVWGTTHGFGPFGRDGAASILLVQGYVIVMATMVAVIAAVVAEHRQAQAQLRELATTDPLTGLANYRRLLDVLRFEIARSNRTERPFAVLFVDMDGLKAINDRHGHLAGSRALCRLAETLKASCRAMDTPTRFGGDEFAVVLPETGEDEGHAVLERIAARLVSVPGEPRVSISGGVAVFPRDGSSPTQLLRSADKVLYEAKTRAASARRHERQRRTGT